MTFTDAWPESYKDQVQFMDKLMNFVQDQDAGSASLGLAQATLPTSGELTAAWQNYIGDSRPIPSGARIQWWDTGRQVLDMIFSTTKDVGTDGSTGTLYPLSPKRRTLDMGVISSDYLAAVGSVSVSLTAAASLWKHMWSSMLLRWSTSNTIPGSARYQQTTNIYFSELIQVQGGVAGRAAFDEPAVSHFPYFFIPGDNGPASNASYQTTFYFNPFGIVLDKGAAGVSMLLSQNSAAPIVSASRIFDVAVGFLNAQVAATTWAIGTGTLNSLAAGSNFVLWGLK